MVTMSEIGIRLLYRIMNVRMSVSKSEWVAKRNDCGFVHTLDEFLG